MKVLYIFIALTLTSCTYNDMRKLFTDRPDSYTKFTGNFHYTKNQTQNANNRLGVEIKKPFYTTKDKKQLYYVGGSVYHNYDVFKTAYHVNGFGHVGVEF
jgi:hypothetical protein